MKREVINKENIRLSTAIINYIEDNDIVMVLDHYGNLVDCGNWYDDKICSWHKFFGDLHIHKDNKVVFIIHQLHLMR